VEYIDAGLFVGGIVFAFEVFGIAEEFLCERRADPEWSEHINDGRTLDEVDGVRGIGLLAGGRQFVAS
jgi:hypothetical protein